MSSHDAERAYVAARLDHLADRFDQARAEMQADLDLYHDDFTSGHAAQLRAHDERMRELEDQQRAWLTRFTNGEANEPAPRQDVGQQESHDASGRGPATPAGVPAGQPNHAAELERARAIAAMPMDEYAKRRAEFGIRNPTEMSRLFGETR